MISLIISLALAADAPAGQTARELSYEHLLDCYGSFMVGKGLTEASSKQALTKWDSAARKACATEIRNHRSLVGPKQFDKDWNGLWGEWWVRV